MDKHGRAEEESWNDEYTFRKWHSWRKQTKKTSKEWEHLIFSMQRVTVFAATCASAPRLWYSVWKHVVGSQRTLLLLYHWRGGREQHSSGVSLTKPTCLAFKGYSARPGLRSFCCQVGAKYLQSYRPSVSVGWTRDRWWTWLTIC